MSEPSVGLVLSGGGARGAYEAGVLLWIANHQPRLLSAMRVITGSSVGAINGVYLASRGLTPESVSSLAETWRSLSLDEVVRFSPAQALRMLVAGARHLVGRPGKHPAGLLASGVVEHFIRTQIDWHALPSQLARGRFDGVAIAATELVSGRTHLFVHHGPALERPRWPHDRSLRAIEGPLQPEHVMASAAIPFVFPPVRVGARWYTDGGVRQNTPLSPALRLGAERLVVVSFGGIHEERESSVSYPGLSGLVGKLFNSVFLDRLTWDLDRLDRINDVLAAGTSIYGPSFQTKMQAQLRALGRRPYGVVPYVNVRPSRDVGQLASRLLSDSARLRSRFPRPFRDVLVSDSTSSADAMSYLLFDGEFAGRLIDLGYADAERYAEALGAIVSTDA